MTSTRKFALALIAMGLIAIVVAAMIFLTHSGDLDAGKRIDSQVFGDYGSFIGGLVGATWTLASVLLVLDTVWLQQEQLKAQAKQIDLMQLSLDNELSQGRAQDAALIQSRQSELFFHLLQRRSEIVSRMHMVTEVGRQKLEYNGPSCFQVLAIEASQKYCPNPHAPQADVRAVHAMFMQKHGLICSAHLSICKLILSAIENERAGYLGEDASVMLSNEMSLHEKLLMAFHTGAMELANIKPICDLIGLRLIDVKDCGALVKYLNSQLNVSSVNP